jgi:hypothetical protein
VSRPRGYIARRPRRAERERRAFTAVLHNGIERANSTMLQSARQPLAARSAAVLFIYSFLWFLGAAGAAQRFSAPAPSRKARGRAGGRAERSEADGAERRRVPARRAARPRSGRAGAQRRRSRSVDGARAARFCAARSAPAGCASPGDRPRALRDAPPGFFPAMRHAPKRRASM